MSDAAPAPTTHPVRLRDNGFRPSRAATVLALLGVGLALMAVSQPTWLTAVGPAAAGQVAVPGMGRQVAPLVPAAAVVLASAAVASTLARGVVRVLVLAVGALACAAVVVGALLVVHDPVGAGSSVLSASTGARTRASAVTLFWPAYAAAGLGLLGAVLAVAGMWARTPAQTSRFAAPAVDAGSGPAGRDPAGSDAAVSGPAARGAAVNEPSGSDLEVDPAGAWDALSRGQDPTAGR